jgi:hypothetical protein
MRLIMGFRMNYRILPFMLSLSKHGIFTSLEGAPFDRLRANGVL